MTYAISICKFVIFFKYSYILLQEVRRVGVHQAEPRLGGEKHVLVHEREI